MKQNDEYQRLIEDYMSLNFDEMLNVAFNYWNMPEAELASLTKVEFAKKAALVDLENSFK